ncbi:MAG TPA: MFS transporter [Syntrophorhabdales bacterium]|nr:MFS transporter [Syntrophorhabdales bacterium]
MAVLKKEKFFYGNIITAAGFIIWFVGWGAFTPSFSVFLKPLIAEFGWSRADASLAYSLSFLSQAAFAVAMGWLTDKLGPRLVIAGLGSGLGICYLMLSRVTALWQFQAVYALVGGIGMSTLTVPVMVTISRWYVKRRGTMMGIVQAGGGFGGLLFPPLAGHLILGFGWRYGYLIYGIINLVAIVGAGLLFVRDPNVMGQHPDGSAVTAHSSTEEGKSDEVTGLSMRSAFVSPQFWIIFGCYAVFGFCRSTFASHTPAHVQDLGFSLMDGATVLAVIWGASSFGRLGMGRLIDYVGNRKTFIASFVMTTGALLIALWAKDLWMLYAYALIFGLAWGNQAVLRFSVASEAFGLASLGLIVGVLGVAESGSATVGAYIAGYIFDRMGHYDLIFWIGVVVSAAGALLAALLKPALKSR